MSSSYETPPNLPNSMTIRQILQQAYPISPSGLRALALRVYGNEVAVALAGDSVATLADSLVIAIERRGLDLANLLVDLRDNTPLVAVNVAEFADGQGIALPPATPGSALCPLSRAWFAERLQKATAQLDRRYILTLLSSDAHVHVDIESMIDAVARGPGLQARWEELLDELASRAERSDDLGEVMELEGAKQLPGVTPPTRKTVGSW